MGANIYIFIFLIFITSLKEESFSTIFLPSIALIKKVYKEGVYNIAIRVFSKALSYILNKFLIILIKTI